MCTLNPFGLAPYIKLLGKKVNMCAECIHQVIAFKLKPQIIGNLYLIVKMYRYRMGLLLIISCCLHYF